MELDTQQLTFWQTHEEDEKNMEKTEEFQATGASANQRSYKSDKPIRTANLRNEHWSDGGHVTSRVSPESNVC